MNLKRRLIPYLIGLAIAVATLAWSSTQTINTVPSGDASFMTNLQNFLRSELPDYNTLRFDAYCNRPVIGGTAPTSVNLTHTISEVTGFVNGSYTFQAATANTYTLNTRTYVYLRDDTDRVVAIAGAAITYSTNLVFAEMAAGSARPTVPTGCVELFYADTDGISIAAVSDLRPVYIYFVQRNEGGVISGASAIITASGQTIFQVMPDGGVSIYANTWSNVPSGVTIVGTSGTSGEITTIIGDSAPNTLSGTSVLSGNSIYAGSIQSGVSAMGYIITGGALYGNLTNVAPVTLSGNTLYGGRVGNWDSASDVTAVLPNPLKGMHLLFMLTQGQASGSTIYVIVNAASVVTGVTDTFSSGNSAFILANVSGATLQYFLALEAWEDGHWYVSGASGLEYRNKL